MKNVLIPYELFLELTLHHLNGIDGFENDIRRGLTKKVNALLDRELYAKYKTAPTEAQREQVRQEYLNRRSIPESCRWDTPPSMKKPIGSQISFTARRTSSPLSCTPTS